MESERLDGGLVGVERSVGMSGVCLEGVVMRGVEWRGAGRTGVVGQG